MLTLCCLQYIHFHTCTNAYTPTVVTVILVSQGRLLSRLCCRRGEYPARTRPRRRIPRGKRRFGVLEVWTLPFNRERVSFSLDLGK